MDARQDAATTGRTLWCMALGIGIALVALLVAEVVVVVQVTHLIGVLLTLALLVVVPMFGIRLFKREGLAALRQVQEKVAARELPGVPLLDGLLIVVAGMFLVVPGFITDAIGLLLLVPPVRAVARTALRWLLFRRVAGTTVRYYR